MNLAEAVKRLVEHAATHDPGYAEDRGDWVGDYLFVATEQPSHGGWTEVRLRLRPVTPGEEIPTPCHLATDVRYVPPPNAGIDPRAWTFDKAAPADTPAGRLGAVCVGVGEIVGHWAPGEPSPGPVGDFQRIVNEWSRAMTEEAVKPFDPGIASDEDRRAWRAAMLDKLKELAGANAQAEAVLAGEPEADEPTVVGGGP